MRDEILRTLDDDLPGAPPGFLLDPDDRRSCGVSKPGVCMKLWLQLRRALGGA